MTDDIAFKPAFELRRLIDTKQISVVELTELYLRRIEALNPKLNAYLTVTADSAIESAKNAQKALETGSHVLGPLHGIPVSIKDLEVTKDVFSSMGSLVFKDYIPDKDSIVVERIRKSGAIILGKTNTPEFGFSGTNENRLGDACRNPWSLECTSGGSSGGAAAGIAAGLSALATGSDGGGSIRIPASFCGIFGIKPSQGRVPRYGGVGRAAHNTFSQAGPITRTVRDSAMMLQVLSGFDIRDPNSMRDIPPDFLSELESGIDGLRIAWSSDLGYAAVDPEVKDISSSAAKRFADLGCSVDEIEIDVGDPFPTFFNIFSIMGAASYGHIFEEHTDKLTQYGVNTIENGRKLTATDYSRCLARVAELTSIMTDLYDKYDLLLTPTMAVTAFPVGQHPSEIDGKKVNRFWGYTPFTFLFNMTMQTAASVPCGFSKSGLPIGLHIVGKRGDEATVLRAAAAFERAYPWKDNVPPIS